MGYEMGGRYQRAISQCLPFNVNIALDSQKRPRDIKTYQDDAEKIYGDINDRVLKENTPKCC